MRHLIATGIVLLCLGALATAQELAEGPEMAPKPRGDITRFLPHNPRECAPEGIGVGGYDLLSYRSDNGPRFGSPEFSASHHDMEYLFESEENRQLFLDDPERYLPAYSGWCAVTLALGRLSCPDFDNFKIENDRLLLFELTGFTNGQALWNTAPDRYRDLADGNYSVVMDHE